ncbi:hypothetical protein GFL38_10420 [Rhizobium leguminosarum bv. viciae]|uniref:hypothetical protein n=1 Tax=Rhizobium ruizarguesonis TaxID=2081791 RepID=UPI00143FACC3|nr:hypothetical protein [Rhizobium ruizarguesonis]NKJ72678.1 hypothetical protein [Rhizobium leguminosarum bv. viciae]NKQ80356.1 hypothetical protein [Rhizobium ruizarguesonis]
MHISVGRCRIELPVGGLLLLRPWTEDENEVEAARLAGELFHQTRKAVVIGMRIRNEQIWDAEPQGRRAGRGSLRVVCNVAKDSAGRSADELFATNPEVFKLDDAYDKPALMIACFAGRPG